MSEPIRVTSHVARDFLQNSAYFNTMPKVAWEYVSNSLDNPRANELVSVEVRIAKDRLVVSDNGSGMSRQGLRNFFQMHAENVRRKEGKEARGRYGTGKCAAFGIADVLRLETIKDGMLNIVELRRADIIRANSGDAFPVKDIVADKRTTEEDGTRIIISGLNLSSKNLDVPGTLQYVERHLGRRHQTHHVIINDHICEYQEPYSSSQQVFRPPSALAKVIGNLELVIKVSPVPLDKELAGIDVLSKGIWHDTTSGSVDVDSARRIFGEVDMPALEEDYENQKIPPFDNTRNMTLNVQNPLVTTLLGWVDECLREVAKELEKQNAEHRATEEAKRLARQARHLEQLLNDDFRTLEMELDRIRRVARVKEREVIDDLLPGAGDAATEYQAGGPEHGEGVAGQSAGPGEEVRPGTGLLPGEEKGGPGKVSQRDLVQTAFHVEHRHEEEKSPRSHYEQETRTIVINLDHPQIARVVSAAGIESAQFRETTSEVAFVEYAIALGHERIRKDEFYGNGELLLDIRGTINRISRAL